MVAVSPPEEAEVRGVKVRMERLRSGPAWRWRETVRYGITLHQRIQWMPEDYSWLRHSSITEPGEDGGWQVYPVKYERAYDEDEAWSVVQKVLDKELGREHHYD